jgi:fimbrial chaperone protein
MEWTQDASGADRYSDTSDLVYFPQQVKVEPGQSRVVRLGYKVPAVQAEKAYRLFIEELAPASRTRSQTGVAITVRFGVPVFLRPIAERLAGELELSLADGAAVAQVRNTGTVHFRTNSVKLTAVGANGDTVLEQTLDGWYVLTGATRAHRFTLPAGLCAKARQLRAEALADKLVLRAERTLAPDDCR